MPTNFQIPRYPVWLQCVSPLGLSLGVFLNNFGTHLALICIPLDTFGHDLGVPLCTLRIPWGDFWVPLDQPKMSIWGTWDALLEAGWEWGSTVALVPLQWPRGSSQCDQAIATANVFSRSQQTLRNASEDLSGTQNSKPCTPHCWDGRVELPSRHKSHADGPHGSTNPQHLATCWKCGSFKLLLPILLLSSFY